jgi:hypothetical protein
VTDGVNPPIVSTFDVNVTNPAPTGVDTSETVIEEEVVTVDVTTLIQDRDGDELTFTSPSLPVWLTLDPVTGVLTGTAPEGSADAGPVVVEVIADDGEGGIVSINVTITPFVPNDPYQTSDAFPDELEEEQITVVEREDPVVPFVVDAVNEINDLNGTDAVDGEHGIIVDTVDSIDELNATQNAEGEDPAVLKAVRAIDALREVHRENGTHSSTIYEDWNVEGLTGFSLKFGYSEGYGDGLTDDSSVGELIIETYVRQRILFIDVNNTFNPETHGTVLRYEVKMMDGSPVPDWVRIVRDGFIVAERPATEFALDLKISAIMSDGEVVSRGVRIDGPTGEINPLELKDTPDNQAAGFSDQLRKIADNRPDVVMYDNDGKPVVWGAR